jgi:hypothetical protein
MLFRGINSLDELIKLSKEKELKIFVDLDGVLCDFDKAFEELGHGSSYDIDNNKLWNIIRDETKHFWRDLDWTPDGKELWNFVKKYYPTILSSPAPAFADPDCARDKVNWVKKHLGKYVEVIIVRNKEKYVEKNAILIDDREKNISKWQENGGIGILHKSAELTIKKLGRIL